MIAMAVASLMATGCAGVRPYRAEISSDDANERILAVKAAGETKDAHAVPLLVDRLEDEDDAVRFFAIIALEKITGRRFGYDYSQPSRQRAASIVRWREYVAKGEFAAAQDPPPNPSPASPRGAAAEDRDGLAAGP